MSDLSSQTTPPWIQIDILVVPPTGTLIFVISADASDTDLVRVREELHAFFDGRKVGVVRAGDLKIACISFEGDNNEN